MESDTASRVSDMKYSLKHKLALAIALVALISVAFATMLSSYIIRDEFNGYIARQQEQRTQGLVTSLEMQYRANGGAWDAGFVHALGMAALDDGYIIRVEDATGVTVWDAQSHDTSLCEDIMRSISERMGSEFPHIDGSFESHEIILGSGEGSFGKLIIGYYEPFFLDENDFGFIRMLNGVTVGAGALAIALASVAGLLLAANISRPLHKAAEASRQISGGNYKVKLDERADTTEIGMLVKSINQLASSLDRQDDIRRRLVEDVSHEIRTPVAILQTHIESMVEGIWQPTSEHLQSCYEEVLRIGQLMGDIEGLKKAGVGGTALEKTEFRIMAAVKRAVEGFEMEIRRKGLNVGISGDDVTVVADEGRISQVIVNLMSNAVKYTEEGGSIGIQVTGSDDTVKVSVTDDGAGIPEDELPFIFERFYRADKSRNRKTGGSGLGLAIVKSIVEEHDGTVSAESGPGQGTKFEVTLPRQL